MTGELVLTPAGHLMWRDADGAAEAAAREPLRRAFAESPAAGLVHLAAHPPQGPAEHYWSQFAARFVAALCRRPDGAAAAWEPVPPPDEAHRAQMLLAAPPMTGAEYLSDAVLLGLWQTLNNWTAQQTASAGGIGPFLTERAPRWRQVGRVCFHLAENRSDQAHPFAFMATFSSGLSREGRLQHLPLQRALQQQSTARDRAALQKLLEPVHRAVGVSSLARELVDSGEIFHPLAWTPDQAYRFLHDVPAFEDCGILVRVPDWWKKRPRPQVAVTIGQSKSGVLSAGALLSFDVEVCLGDDTLTDEEWRQLMDAPPGLVRLRGQWVELDREKLREAMEHWKAVRRHAERGEISFVEGMRLLAGAPADLAGPAEAEAEARWSFIRPGRELAELMASLCDPSRKAAPIPADRLRATLRPYQQTGVNWLWLCSRIGLGACLADDMGLGKTLQVLALLLCGRQEATGEAGLPSLLVVPASLLSNWKAEADRFAPSLRLHLLHPSQMAPAAMRELLDDEGALRRCDLLVTTYTMAARIEQLAGRRWRLLILDEAQAIKNPSARQTRAIKALQADARIALTGTPVENRLGDLWSLMDFLNPGLLGSAKRFGEFVKALERRERDQYAPLRKLVRPYILRRLKTDKSVIADLPDKTEMQTYCGLTKAQAALYQASVEELAQTLETAEGIQRRGLVLAYLMRFKQICNHPSQFSGDGVYDPAHSGKFARLADLAQEIASRQEKALVFTQFREMTGPLAEHLAAQFGREGLVLHGSTPVKQRRELVEQFQREDGPPFFVLSLKAGGTGLNLTAASHVIHFDRWWNPAVENQATDRAFRIGQKRNVLVHKFVTEGTVEEKIDELIAEKTALADDLLRGGAERMLTELTDKELLRMVSLNISRVEA